MKILIVSESIAPAGVVASIRWTKIGKYLKKNHNIIVDVLTTKKRFSDSPKATYYKFDAGLAEDLEFFNKVWEVPKGLRFLIIDSLFVGFERIIKAPQNREKNRVSKNSLPARNNNNFNLDRNFTKQIYNKLYGAFLRIKGYSVCHHARKMDISWDSYDVVVSSFGPSWVHVLGKWVKEKNPNIKWIADYRDSAISTVDVPEKEKSHFAQRFTKKADLITAVSQGVLDNLFLSKNQKNTVVTNGFDPSDLVERSRQKSNKFIISYTGTLYSEKTYKSDLTPLLIAIRELIAKKTIDPSELLLVYAGGNSDLFNSQLKEFESTIPSLDVGCISRSDCYTLQDSSSLLILCTWNTKEMQGVVTGKIFEYLTSNVPIVGLCSGDLGNSEIKNILIQSQAGFCYEEANKEFDYIELKKYIALKYSEWKSTGFTEVETNRQYVSSFGYDCIAEQYYDLFLKLNKELDINEK